MGEVGGWAFEGLHFVWMMWEYCGRGFAGWV